MNAASRLLRNVVVAVKVAVRRAPRRVLVGGLAGARVRGAGVPTLLKRVEQLVVAAFQLRVQLHESQQNRLAGGQGTTTVALELSVCKDRRNDGSNNSKRKMATCFSISSWCWRNFARCASSSSVAACKSDSAAGGRRSQPT